MKTLPILLLPEKTAFQFEMLDKYWRWQGGQVRILDEYHQKDASLVGQQIAIYGNPEFANRLAEMYNVRLITPDRKAILKIRTDLLEREVKCSTIGAVSRDHFPAFISPVVPKVFPAGVYKNVQHFKETVEGIRRKEEVLISPVIHDITAKARGFVLNGKMMAAAIYEGESFMHWNGGIIDIIAYQYRSMMPSTYVIDIAETREKGWMLLDFKSTWEADLRGCGASKVIDCIVAATVAM